MSALQHTRPALAFAARLLAFPPLLALTACSHGRAPSFMIMGSYFPAWLIGLAISLLLTVAIRQCLIRAGIDDALPVRLLVYVCLCVLLTLAFTYVFSPR